jgi:NAD-dependent SIR2 family protein deacetylase
MHEPLTAFIQRHPRLFVLTGAGCSTESGIPDYRDADGEWKRAQPVMYQDFMRDRKTRARYWARSLVGWPQFRKARPNAAHHALVRLEQRGRIELLATQNVDRLHQLAGSQEVVDLHGRLDEVRCMNCAHRLAREQLQLELQQRNPRWAELSARAAPDGDADLEGLDFAGFQVLDCALCGGILKPDVVFFGEIVPQQRVLRCMSALLRADAMLVLGTSLMVWSGYRFVQAAAEAGKPIAAVNLGHTRADELFELKVPESVGAALAYLLESSTVRSANA